CEQALAHLNQKEYKLSDDITALYLNPFEAEKEVIQYASKVNIPFPVIPNAKAIGEAYGVEGFPTFFLINEQGKIEKISNYQKEFLDSLKQ
ncbi:MAG: TlpA family protein disulfide reductase, partial [Bacteroidota bacterium]